MSSDQRHVLEGSGHSDRPHRGTYMGSLRGDRGSGERGVVVGLLRLGRSARGRRAGGVPRCARGRFPAFARRVPRSARFHSLGLEGMPLGIGIRPDRWLAVRRGGPLRLIRRARRAGHVHGRPAGRISYPPRGRPREHGRGLRGASRSPSAAGSPSRSCPSPRRSIPGSGSGS